MTTISSPSILESNSFYLKMFKVISYCFQYDFFVYYSPVTLEQCRHESAMLLFTVMDYDVLTANDFAGEALLSLNVVPGVATTPQGLDTFHGLKQIDLVLMHQTNKRKSWSLLGKVQLFGEAPLGTFFLAYYLNLCVPSWGLFYYYSVNHHRKGAGEKTKKKMKEKIFFISLSSSWRLRVSIPLFSL